MPAARVLVGIGDDAAVWQPSRSNRSVITTDALVERVHFRRDSMPLHDIGRRAMAANLSDIAAMGARPVLATVALGIPVDCSTGDILSVYHGMQSIARTYGFTIAGGDVTRAQALTFSITIVGEVRASRLKLRSGARPGDVLAVTGELGGNRASGYRAVPVPRVAEGKWLAASTAVHAMMDLSDGLSSDVSRLCRRSGCGATIENIPVSRGVSDAARAAKQDVIDYVLAAGEDYELMAAVDQRAFPYLARRFARRFGSELHPLGSVRAEPGVRLRTSGRDEPLTPSGWDHLR